MLTLNSLPKHNPNVSNDLQEKDTLELKPRTRAHTHIGMHKYIHTYIHNYI